VTFQENSSHILSRKKRTKICRPKDAGLSLSSLSDMGQVVHSDSDDSKQYDG